MERLAYDAMKRVKQVDLNTFQVIYDVFTKCHASASKETCKEASYYKKHFMLKRNIHTCTLIEGKQSHSS